MPIRVERNVAHREIHLLNSQNESKNSFKWKMSICVYELFTHIFRYQPVRRLTSLTSKKNVINLNIFVFQGKETINNNKNKRKKK